MTEAETKTETPTPAEAEHEVEEARADLEETLDELTDKFKPEALLEQAKSYVAGKDESLGDVLIREARANPLAAIMIGAGMTWLLIGARRRYEGRQTYGDVSTRAYDDPTTSPPPSNGTDAISAGKQDKRDDRAPDV